MVVSRAIGFSIPLVIEALAMVHIKSARDESGVLLGVLLGAAFCENLADDFDALVADTNRWTVDQFVDVGRALTAEGAL